MARGRLGFALLAASLGVAGVCGALIFWRLSLRPHGGESAPPSPVAFPVKPAPLRPIGLERASTVIDLPGDPLLVRRTAVSAPRDFPVSLPTRLDLKAPKVDSAALYVASALLSADSGAMVKFSDAGQEANVLAFQIAANAAALSGDSNLDSGATDDDGGAETPLQPEAASPAPASSNSVEIRLPDAPAIKTVVVRTSASDRISAVLTANGFSDESASRVEAAFKAQFNFQSLPPGGACIAVGERDATGAYRVGQLVIYQGADYVGTVALSENGSYLEGARPASAASLIDDSATSSALNARYTLADGLYSAGLRSAAPESVVREAIQLVGHGVDLKAPLTADETFKALFARDARGKAKDSSRIIYVGVAGSAGAYDCYVYESETLPLVVSIPKRPPVRRANRPARRRRRQAAGQRRRARTRRGRQSRPKPDRRGRT